LIGESLACNFIFYPQFKASLEQYFYFYYSVNFSFYYIRIETWVLHQRYGDKFLQSTPMINMSKCKLKRLSKLDKPFISPDGNMQNIMLHISSGGKDFTELECVTVFLSIILINEKEKNEILDNQASIPCCALYLVGQDVSTKICVRM